MKKYRDNVPTREARSNKIVPMEEFRANLKGYQPELQCDQLQPRNIDPNSLQRKSEGDIMRTFQPKSLMSAALDQLSIDQLRVAQGMDNALRIAQIARDTHSHP